MCHVGVAGVLLQDRLMNKITRRFSDVSYLDLGIGEEFKSVFDFWLELVSLISMGFSFLLSLISKRESNISQ